MNVKGLFSDSLLGVKPQAKVVNGVRYTFDGAEGDQLNPLIGLAPAAFAALPVLLADQSKLPWEVFAGTFLATDLAIAQRLQHKRLNSTQRYTALAIMMTGAAASYWFTRNEPKPALAALTAIGALGGRIVSRGFYIGFEKAFLSGDVPSEELV